MTYSMMIDQETTNTDSNSMSLGLWAKPKIKLTNNVPTYEKSRKLTKIVPSLLGRLRSTKFVVSMWNIKNKLPYTFG